MHYALTIGGKPAATTKTFNVLNPADETVVAACPEATTDLVDEAVQSARRAFPSWAALPDSERSAKLLAIADLIEKHHSELSELVTREQGKTQSEPILDSEMKEWVLWMTTIFMPLNDIREKIIIEKAYLIVEEHMPHCLLDFVTHVVGYKAVLSKWAEGDYSERRSTIGWPPEFDDYVTRSYNVLKAQQTHLLHGSAWQLYHYLRGRKRG